MRKDSWIKVDLVPELGLTTEQQRNQNRNSSQQPEVPGFLPSGSAGEGGVVGRKWPSHFKCVWWGWAGRSPAASHQEAIN